ncbi:hypothetical protein AMECASPLE_009253 [Ameca splendens]|uniref:Uncharacterized protein n=1 Tax=Ameca splendens TaxID=208324 RepID=A0ABV0YC16_9TELE
MWGTESPRPSHTASSRHGSPVPAARPPNPQATETPLPEPLTLTRTKGREGTLPSHLINSSQGGQERRMPPEPNMAPVGHSWPDTSQGAIGYLTVAHHSGTRPEHPHNQHHTKALPHDTQPNHHRCRGENKIEPWLISCTQPHPPIHSVCMCV